MPAAIPNRIPITFRLDETAHAKAKIIARLEDRPLHMFSANFVFYTGNAVTFPTGKAIIGGIPLPVYSNRNDYRMPNYHRLDLSYTLKGKERPNQIWNWDLNFSLYNAYGRHNPWMINFYPDKVDTSKTYAEMTYLFGVIPSVTFNFKVNLSKLSILWDCCKTNWDDTIFPKKLKQKEFIRISVVLKADRAQRS